MEPRRTLLCHHARHHCASAPARAVDCWRENRQLAPDRLSPASAIWRKGACCERGFPIKPGARQRCPEETAVPALPDPADLEALREFDTPTICNALELVAPARRAIGFTRRPLIAAFPQLKPVVAFARTAIIRSREAHPRSREEATRIRLAYYDHIAAA